jgi:hypothetical protein
MQTAAVKPEAASSGSCEKTPLDGCSPLTWGAAISDSTGAVLKLLVDRLVKEGADEILRLKGSNMEEQEETAVFELLERVDYGIEEIVDNMDGLSADLCLLQLRSARADLMDLLLQSGDEGRLEADEWSCGSSSGYETGSENDEQQMLIKDDQQSTVSRSENVEQQMSVEDDLQSAVSTKRGMSSL